MVGNLTVGKKTYAAVEDDVRATLERLALLRNKLLALIESDAQAFEPLAASYRMPKATPEEAAAKQAALQLALGPACDVPLIIMRTCAEVIDHATFSRITAASWPFRTRARRQCWRRRPWWRPA